MKGNDKVIERLNKALFLELGAVNQYWLHYRLLDDWGYQLLAKKEREESIEEIVREVLEADLAGEYEARTAYKESRDICHDAGDYVTMKLFEELLADEEGHIDFLETQLELHDKIGPEKYGQLNAAPASEAD